MGILGHLEDCWGTPKKCHEAQRWGGPPGTIFPPGFRAHHFCWSCWAVVAMEEPTQRVIAWAFFWLWHVAMDQYLLIPFLGGWTSIYQLFWCSPGVQGFDPSPCGFPSLSFHSITFFLDPHLRGANVLASWIVLLPSRTWRWKWKFHLV